MPFPKAFLLLGVCLFLCGCGGGGGIVGQSGAPSISAASASPSPAPSAGASPTSTPSSTASPAASPSPSPSPTTASAAAPASASASGDLIWGASGHPTTAYGAVTLDEQMATLARLGMTHYRVGAEWHDKLEDMLQVAARHGVTLLPVITPDLNFANHSATEIYANSYKTAYEVAARFRGRVKVWELGNELEGYAIILPCEIRDSGVQYPCAWGPAGGVEAEDYVGARWAKVSAALKGMSDGVHAADPSALRAAGSAGWGHTGSFDRMKADGIGWDISVWHTYQQLEAYEWAMKRLAGFGKPIWITEFNQPFGSTYGEGLQAEGLKKMMADIRKVKSTYNIQAAFVYELLDEPYWTDSEGTMGLVRLVKDSAGRWVLGGDKPSADAVRATIAAGR